MGKILILTAVLGVVTADIGLKYRVPQTSYGVPSYQYNNGGSEYNTGSAGYTYKAPAQAGYVDQNAGYQSGFQVANSLASNNGAGSQYYQTGASSAGSSLQPSFQYNTADAGTAQGGYQTFNQYQTSNQYQASSQYQTSAVQKYQEFYNQYQQQPAQVFKHFYVHAAPEEPEVPKFRQPVSLPPPQKHYKIIFIKAPTQTVYQPQYVPVPQNNEEQTIVYVLVKKPEEQQEVVVPKIEQKQPTKPEVFFIKYKNKGDTQAVINNIVGDYNKGGPVTWTGSDSQLSSGSASGQYSSGSGTGQYSSGSGSGQYSSGSGSGQYNAGQYVQSIGQGTTAGYGTQSYGGLSGQSLTSVGSSAVGGTSAATGAYNNAATAGYTTAGATSAATSAASTGNFDNFNTISTSQGVPHETYGPPKFRV